MPKLGEYDRQRRMYGLPFALIAGGCVGFYDGFFGPAAGSFLRAGLRYAVRHLTSPKPRLTPNYSTQRQNIGGLLLFILGGKVIWATGFVMLVGQFLGARMGSRLVLSKGQKLIRPMIVKFGGDECRNYFTISHGQEILHWLGMN
ncbi:TSUP family transporter [Escherichia coli]